MDLLTQGLAGSVLAVSFSNKAEIKKASLIGFLSGLSADVDFFIRSANDPLLNLEFHRHFTHSIFFIPFAAIILSILFWPFFRRHLSYNKIFLFSFLGYAPSGFIDACTSYGTRLLWPLSDERISFNIISIIDPIFTLLLLIGLILSLKVKKILFVQIFIILAASYLFMGLIQKQRITHETYKIAQQQRHAVDRVLVKPTLGNHWLWRSVYESNGVFYINALRMNPFNKELTVYPGNPIKKLNIDYDLLAWRKNTTSFKDIKRFAYFSNDYLAIDPQDMDVITDVRYSNLPNSRSPLWGIRINRDEPMQHASYEIYRDKSRQTREQFINMLLGQ